MVKLGLLLNQEEAPEISTPRWADIRSMALGAESIGFDSLWLVDHFVWRGDPWRRDPDESHDYGVWEAWTTLSALAALTSRVEIGTLVTCAGYRNPALIAKMATTADEISGGRIILGLGAGDDPDEHDRFGFEFGRRVDRFAEALAIIVPLLRTGRADFVGTHHVARDAAIVPRGPRPGGVPVLIGSLAHAPRMLGLTARYADIWNGWFTALDDLEGTLAAVDAACIAEGRDPRTLRRTASIPIAFSGPMVGREYVRSGSPTEIADALGPFMDGRLDSIQLIPFPNQPATLEHLEALLVAIRS